MCFEAFSLHAAPDGAEYREGRNYKHVAPPEQGYCGTASSPKRFDREVR